MIDSYRGQVASALELLAEGLAPLVDRRMRQHMQGQDWILEAASRLGKRRDVLVSLSDPHFQLEVLNRWWGPVFSSVLPEAARPLVNELRTARNHWAHPTDDQPIDLAYATRVLVAAEELLRMIGAPEADEMLELADDLRWDSVRRTARRRGVSETAALMDQLADLQKEYADLQAQLADAHGQARSATGRSRAVARQLAELQAQYAAVSGLRDDYEALQRELLAERQAHSGREGGAAPGNDDLAEAEGTLAHLQSESERLRHELDAARVALDALDPTSIPEARRWIWLAATLILLLGVMVVMAYYVGVNEG